MGAEVWIGLAFTAAMAYGAWSAKKQGCEARDVKALAAAGAISLLASAVLGVSGVLLPPG
ncbi:hypothetical protein [Variovorax sp. GB1P17]|uniref:hypothetical protein n=1 Tax=Variovorax sp. GB1P17 TaxID=3443740 RepID=UPI003F46ABF9